MNFICKKTRKTNRFVTRSFDVLCAYHTLLGYHVSIIVRRMFQVQILAERAKILLTPTMAAESGFVQDTARAGEAARSPRKMLTENCIVAVLVGEAELIGWK